MTRTALAGTLIGTVVLTAGLSASPAQSAATRVHQPEAEQQSSVAESGVVLSLPPVNFGASDASRHPRSAFAAALAERQRVQAVQHVMPTQKPDTTRTICGLTMMEQSPDLDAKILLPPDRGEGAAVRRIDPQACTGR